MRSGIAKTSGKLISKVLRLRERHATTLPGFLALKIDQNVLYDLQHNRFNTGVILVTGTNGKTTTTAMLVNAIKACGKTVITNKGGSNLERGIVTALLQAESKADYGVFEVDEAYIPRIVEILKPSTVVVTNLFRDQLDRYGELDSIAKSFRKCFESNKPKLILNADDPLVASLGMGYVGEKLYFGISDYNKKPLVQDHSADSIFDPFSGDKLTYIKRYFGHIGIYETQNAKFKRPKPQIELIKLKSLSKNGSKFDVKITTQVKTVSVNLPGIYNIYNCLAVMAVSKSLALNNEQTIKAIEESIASFGRAEVLKFEKTDYHLLLVKNPTGFNQIISTFLDVKQNTTPILMIINDNLADGRDVSWLWDTAFEAIEDYKGKIVVSGTRALDMQLRLKYAGLSDVSCEADISKALDYFVEKNSSDTEAYIIPTYTAMLKVRSLLKSKIAKRVAK